MKRHRLHTVRLKLTREKIKHARVLCEYDRLLALDRDLPHTRDHRALLARQPADDFDALHPVLRIVGGKMHGANTREDRNEVACLAVIA